MTKRLYVPFMYICVDIVGHTKVVVYYFCIDSGYGHCACFLEGSGYLQQYQAIYWQISWFGAVLHLKLLIDAKNSFLFIPFSVAEYWKFESRSWRGVLDTTLCNKDCQWFAAGRWFSPSTPVSSTNKTDRHDIPEILLKVVLNTITLYLQTPVAEWENGKTLGWWTLFKCPHTGSTI